MADTLPNTDVVLFGKTEFRGSLQHFGIKLDDRRRHLYVIGKSGMGKSELLKNLAIQDIQDGRGVCFMDPHGDLVNDLLDYIPAERIKDVIYFNPADMQFPIAFNVLEQVSFDQRHLVADGLMAVFKKIWVDQWSARMEYILNYTILALLEAPDSTLLGINRMLAEKDYRNHVVSQVSDPEVKAFWNQEFAKYTDKFATEATAAIQNKIGQFVSNSLIRNIVGQIKTSFNMREAMDQHKIILVDISKGRIGEDASRLLGAMLITKIQTGAMSRVDIPRSERADFTLIVDEFQNFATASFASILSEARKFNLSLIIAHQYVKQLDEAVADAVFGNVGTMVTFRVGAEDAELLEKEFMPEFEATDIVNLGFRQMYLKLMIDGVTSHAFSAMTMDTIAKPEVSYRDQVIEYSRSIYSQPRAEAEAAIAAWRAPMPEPERPPRAFSDASEPRGAPSPYPSQQVSRPGMAPTGPLRHSFSEARQPPRRDDRPPRRDDRGPQQQQPNRQPRGPRHDNRPRPPQQSSQQPAQSLKELLPKGESVPTPEEVKADGVSVDLTPEDDLKTLIARALGKEKEGTS